MGKIWRRNGVYAKAKAFDNELVGAYEDLDPSACIVLGCSREAWKDYKDAQALFDDKKQYHTIAVNDIAHQLRQPIEHIVSVHHRIVGSLRTIRKEKMLEDVYTHSAKEWEGVDYAWGAIEGNSGTFAVKIALVMGYKKIIVCGIGIDDTGHYYDPIDHVAIGAETFDDRHRNIWKELRRDSPEAKRRIRIMSGSLMELYGKADHGWIQGKQEKKWDEEIDIHETIKT